MALTLEQARTYGYEKSYTKPLTKIVFRSEKKAEPKKTVNKSPSKKNSKKSVESKKAAKPKSHEKEVVKSMVITENLEKLSLLDLNDILEKHKIFKKDITGTGKSGRVLKIDMVLSIKDHEARLHDGKPLKIKTAEKPKKKSPEKKPKKKSPEKKPKKKSPEKKPSITILSSPKKGKRIVSVEKLTTVEAFEELRKHEKYKRLTDYQIKKLIGGKNMAKVADLRQEVRNLMGDGSIKSEKKKSPEKKKAISSSDLKCENRKKCPGAYCDTHDGKCISKNKDGKPRNEKALKEKIGKDFVFNEKYGLIGSNDDVKAHIKLWKKIHAEKKKSPKKKGLVKKGLVKKGLVKKSPVKKSPVKKSPVKKSPVKKSPVVVKNIKRCASADMKSFGGYDNCQENEACDVLTGKCIDNAKISKSGQNSLKVDGRTIIGDLETLKKLQNVLGGALNKTPEKKQKSPEKKQKSPEKKQKSPEKKISAIVGASRSDIEKTFRKCLDELNK